MVSPSPAESWHRTKRWVSSTSAQPATSAHASERNGTPPRNSRDGRRFNCCSAVHADAREVARGRSSSRNSFALPGHENFAWDCLSVAARHPTAGSSCMPDRLPEARRPCSPCGRTERLSTSRLSASVPVAIGSCPAVPVSCSCHALSRSTSGCST